MTDKNKDAIETYQCPGCIVGCDISCFSGHFYGIGCSSHVAGTKMNGIGTIFIGLPKGFNRLGNQTKLQPTIYEKFSDNRWDYNIWNVPVWKYLNNKGHTIVRGYMPRINEGFIHIFLEDCRDQTNCLEIKQEDINDMD